MENDGDWIADANSAVTISLVASSEAGLQAIESFSPAYTYPIFGDAQEIFGYKDLKISLQYHARDMRPCVSVTYGKKFKAIGETKPTDIEGTLKGFLPSVAFQKSAEFKTMISQRSDNWKPPGDLVGSVNNKDQTYEVWRSSLTSPIAKQLLQRVQILVPFFIEGGSCIEEEELDSRWDIFFFYQNEPGEDGEPSYIFAGYSTVYRFFFLLKNESQAASKDPDSLLGADFDPSTLPCRSRISQFLVLPPFQGQGLGPKFYNVIYNTFLNHAPTMEITVEDPNENFDDLRDIADLRFLREKADFTSLKINTDLKFDGKNRKVPADLVDRRAWETVRRKYKIAPRQFARVVELFLMSQLPSTIRAVFPSQCTNAQKPTKEDQHQYRLWKLLVKERIYRKNKDTLGQLELHERIAKLEETLSSVEFDYARLLEKDARDDSEPSSNGHGKRKLDDSEDAVSKRVRLDDQEGTASEKGATGL